MDKILKSRKPGKEIKTYTEFVKLNPKNIYIEDTVDLFLYSYSTSVTVNYTKGNTVDLIVTTAGLNNKTLTMYPVDANYLENKLNNIIRKYNIYNIEPLKINH